MMLRAIQILGVLLIIASVYDWYSSRIVPDQSALSETTGRINNVTHTHDKYGNVSGIKFTLDNERRHFSYASFFPQFVRAKDLLNPGATVRIAHERDGNNIWVLTVDNEIVADFNSLKLSRRSNGNAALICAIGFMVAVVGLEWYIRRTA
jgi:hypothetical protein